VPDVPPVFRWRSPGGAEVVVAYQSGGYGGRVEVPGCDEVLVFVHAGDNAGPPSADEVVAAHRSLASRFPGAEVRASTLDAFARALVATGAAGALPVVTAEVGDPWIFGAASDPAKVSAYRDALRARSALTDADVRRAVDRSLLLVAEHTWGLDQKEALPDTEHWDRAGLEALRSTREARRFEASWAEQRAYVEAVGPLRAGAWGRVGSGPVAPPAEVLEVADGVEPGRVVRLGEWELAIDAGSGAVVHLADRSCGRVLADHDHRLAEVTYQAFDAADYERFSAGLVPAEVDEWWARLDNTKPGIDAVAVARSGRWPPDLEGAWLVGGGASEGEELVVRAAFGPELVGELGAPAVVWSRWSVGAAGGLAVEVGWDHKAANRLPEALWCSFVPAVAEPHRWVMDKMGEPVSPLDVVRHGGRALPGVGDGGVSHPGASRADGGRQGALRLRSFDAVLVAPGRPNLLDADPSLPDLAGGWHVLLADNCWGTNFPMWIEGPARFRFALDLDPPAGSVGRAAGT
jgi:hypothetical protein